MRLLLDEGPLLVPLLQRVHADWPAEDPIVAEDLQRLLNSLGASDPAPDPVHATAEAAPTLTKPEVKVLQLLADGYSNGAMAEKLFVSDSTVRTHLRSINLKLGAHSRSQAVAAARRLAVIR